MVPISLEKRPDSPILETENKDPMNLSSIPLVLMDLVLKQFNMTSLNSDAELIKKAAKDFKEYLQEIEKYWDGFGTRILLIQDISDSNAKDPREAVGIGFGIEIPHNPSAISSPLLAVPKGVEGKEEYRIEDIDCKPERPTLYYLRPSALEKSDDLPILVYAVQVYPYQILKNREGLSDETRVAIMQGILEECVGGNEAEASEDE